MNVKNLINNEITQDEFLRYKNATLLFKKMPSGYNGLILRKNNINIIIINDHLNIDEKKKVFLHEASHLELDHTYKYRIVNNDCTIYEQEVDNYINELNFD